MESTYCVKCRAKTGNVNPQIAEVNGRACLKSTCDVCGTRKSRFLPKGAAGKGIYEFLGKTVGKLTGDSGLTLPGSNFIGPFNSISPEYVRTHPPTNRVDLTAYRHDVAYNNADQIKATGDKEAYTRMIRAADAKMLEELDGISDPTLTERIHRGIARAGISSKMKLDRLTGNGHRRPHVRL